ncbi:hypothetical protein GTZ99_12755 [Novosphingobium sp. FSY-8]|uniref:Methyl-accepting transducer domain-containing protein n=1 Tax=Novosphingobium ovatum TaxID=1908523 RepID=A0ABW9XFU6_9SPHN|nr:methyl-accepting chemotaxis protein [Novosphingobium ovatum]NBC37420.1 hypothetical protein [Novosphingobium ovatum]
MEEAVALPPEPEATLAPAPNPEWLAQGQMSDLPQMAAHALSLGLRPETLSLIQEMGSYANFVEIMQRHLDNVCSGTERAAEEIMGQVLHIEGDLSGLVQYVTHTVNSSEFLHASDAVINSIGEGHTMIRDLVRHHLATQCRIRDNLSEVNRVSVRMKDHLEDIEKIRRQTDLLAINARIRIASLGQQTGLDVIAQEIRGLATQTGDLAQNLRGELKEMDELIRSRLVQDFNEQETRDNDSINHLQTTFDRLQENMQRMIAMQGGLIEAVRSRAHEMDEPLMNLVGSIQFQDVARQQIELVGQALNMISDHFVSLSQAIINGEAPPDSSIARCLTLILENYVMEEQRAAHTGPGACDGGAAIELF